MAHLLIGYHNLKSTPGVAGCDAYRWHVGVKHSEDEDESILLVVDVSRTTAAQTGLSRTELDARLEDALQRYASPRLDNDRPVGEQVLCWSGPIVLGAEHFDLSRACPIAVTVTVTTPAIRQRAFSASRPPHHEQV